MGWRAKAGRKQEVLGRIVARLISLAGLAEQAAGRSPWVRWQVLWALWHADAEVRNHFAHAGRNGTGRLWPPLPILRYGTAPADALDLAASLRALALIVQAMATQLGRLAFLLFDRTSGDGDLSHLAGLMQRRATAAVSPVELRDTS
ncbi:hypothetical protein [Mesorhizobium australicum]|uniref:Uncharacterized protein n=1 Tax=Mesorhizobium australicum TaxID=536018 RepID=A0A1X7N4A5_9HYPH|nr:hypothetical protein [Mesorhizobium australicum]SMH32165.1 hypothetical protein SAMN02982922_1254 [Mesorhizobium australicum]